MNKPADRRRDATGPWRDQRGITGLETAIVLIAFVVVASVFAFAVLSTGLLSSEKAETTVVGALGEAGTTIAVKGSIIAYEAFGATSTSSTVGRIQIPIVTATEQAVDLSATNLVVTYIDDTQVVDLDQNTSAEASPGFFPGWDTAFTTGSGPVMALDERAYFWVNVQGLTSLLGPSTQFSIQIKPTIGTVLEVNRTTPGEITVITNLN